jgi:hypothetical protein
LVISEQDERLDGRTKGSCNLIVVVESLKYFDGAMMMLNSRPVQPVGIHRVRHTPECVRVRGRILQPLRNLHSCFRKAHGGVDIDPQFAKDDIADTKHHLRRYQARMSKKKTGARIAAG